MFRIGGSSYSELEQPPLLILRLFLKRSIVFLCFLKPPPLLDWVLAVCGNIAIIIKCAQKFLLTWLSYVGTRTWMRSHVRFDVDWPFFVLILLSFLMSHALQRWLMTSTTTKQNFLSHRTFALISTLVSDKELEAFLEVFYFLSHQIVLMFIRMQIDMAANGMSCRYEKGIISKTPLM